MPDFYAALYECPPLKKSRTLNYTHADDKNGNRFMQRRFAAKKPVKNRTLFKAYRVFIKGLQPIKFTVRSTIPSEKNQTELFNVAKSTGLIT